MNIGDLKREKRELELELAEYARQKLKAFAERSGVTVTNVYIGLIEDRLLTEATPRIVGVSASVEIDV